MLPAGSVWWMALTLRLPVELEGALEARCAATGASKSGVVRLALEQFLGLVEAGGAAPDVTAGESEPLPVSASSRFVPHPFPEGGKVFRGPDPRAK